MTVCASERLRLRHFVLADAEFILRLLNEPSFIHYIADKGVRTLEDARNYLQSGPLAGYAAHGFGLNCIELTDSGTPVGMCGILKRDSLPDPDLGYALLPDYWSHGYAFEAAGAIMTHAEQVLRLPRVLAITNADNAASIRLLEKTKFRLVGPVRLSADEPELKLYSLELPRPAAMPV